MFLVTILPYSAYGSEYDLSVSSSLTTATINLSSQGMGDQPFSITGGTVTWGDHPYVTLEFDIQISGNVPENPNKPDVLAKATVSITTGEGLYVDYTVEPNYIRIPYTAHAVVKIHRYSEVGDRQLIINANAGGESDQTTVNIKLTRSKVSISVKKPEDNDHFQSDNLKIEGSIDPAVGGVVVHFDLYHKYPELKTQEQISGYRSGIQLRGWTVTKPDGSFVIDSTTGAFERFPLSGISMSAIKEGVWYLHFFTRGLKLYGDDLKRIDYRRPMATAYGAVKTYDSDYMGTPPTGGDVPKEHVRKFILAVPEIELKIEGGNPLYPAEQIGHNVFRRKVDLPRFEVTVSGSSHELVAAGVAEIRLNFSRPGRFTADGQSVKSTATQEVNYHTMPVSTIKFQKDSEIMSTQMGEPGEEYKTYESTWVATWDWRGDYGGGVTGDAAEEIPLGIYGVQAVLWDVKGNKALKTSTPKSSYVPGFDSFFVIYDFDPKDKLVTEQSYTDLVVFPPHKYGDWWTKKNYKLHQYDIDVLALSLKKIQYYGAWRLDGYKNLFRADITSPDTIMLDTALVISNDIISGLRGQVIRYDDTLKHGFFDTETARREGRGICTDATAIAMEFIRAVGIPCRYVSGRCYHVVSRKTDPVGHAWVEVWDEKTQKWYNFDPTNRWAGQRAIDYMAGILTNPSYGQYYPANGAPLKGAGIVPLGTYEGYFVLTEDPVSKNVVNRYKEYSYIASIENVGLDRGPGTLPEHYEPGDTVSLECDILNPGVRALETGSVKANPHIRVQLVQSRRSYVGRGSAIVKSYTTIDERPLPDINAGGSAHYTLSAPLPQGTLMSPMLRIEVYYIFNYFIGSRTFTKHAIMDSQEVVIPFKGPSTPSLETDGEVHTLLLPSRSETEVGDDGFTSTELYAFEELLLRRTSQGEDSEARHENFMLTGIAQSTDFSLNWPVEDIGESVYLPGLGAFSSNTSGINEETSQIGITRDGSITVYTFSPKIFVSSISFGNIRGERLCVITANWSDNVVSGEEVAFSIYSEAFEGTDLPEHFLEQALFSLNEGGVRLVSVEPVIPQNIFSTDVEDAEITFWNDAPFEQAAEVYLELSGPATYYNTSREILFNESRVVTVPALSSQTLTVPLDHEYTPIQLPWELVYSVEGGPVGRIPLFSEYPIHIEVEEIQLEPWASGSLEVNITNISNYEIEEISAVIGITNGLLQSDEQSARNLGTLSPGECRLLQWSIVAGDQIYVTVNLDITSGSKKIYGAEFDLQVVGNGILDVDDIIIQAQPSKGGELKTIDFDIRVENIGLYDSLPSWIELKTAEGVSELGDIYVSQLGAGEETNIRGSIQHTLDSSFSVILNVGNSQGVKSSSTIFVEMAQKASTFNLLDYSYLVMLIPALEIIYIILSRRKEVDVT